MPKFTFIGEHTDLYGKPDGTKVTYECNVESLNSVLEHMELFIRGCGYGPTGVLDFVEEEDFLQQEESLNTIPTKIMNITNIISIRRETNE